MISFEVTPTELELVRQCAERAAKMAKEIGREKYNQISSMMDLEACHANGCPLDFEKLLAFPDFDFAHDVFGIDNHIDRNDGKLKHCFLPRCSKPAKG